MLHDRLLRATLRLFMAILLPVTGAQAQVAVNQILFPSNVGRLLDVTVAIDWTRTSAAPAVIQTVIPAQLSIEPPALPAGCVSTTVAGNPAVDCTVPAGAAGASGTLTFQVRGAALGSFSLVATGTGGSSASNTGTVRSSGELTVLKSKSPVGNLLPGQSTSFTLQPQLAPGADDLPAGAQITVTDQLPGTAADFGVGSVSAAGASCNSASAANSSRTVSCTVSGPLTVAQVNAVTITVTGAPGTTGTFTNVGSTAATNPGYYDLDPNNNTVNVNYTVDPGGDVQAAGSFPSAAVATGTAQTLTLGFRNNGPTAVPAGGTVSTTIPAGFTVSSLPAGCSGPATGVALAAPALLTCTAAAAAVGSTQNFAIPLLMPAAPGSGSFTVTVAMPAGLGDAVPANDALALPWTVVPPFADLRAAKSKSPASGPIAPGSTVTTTLTVTNDSGSTDPAAWSASGGATPLRVVDYLKPTEIAGDVLSNVSAGWTCSVSDAADPADAARSKRVLCLRNAAGTLAPGASLSVSFSTTVAPVAGQVTLSNRMCTGESLLAHLGLAAADGPQPPGGGQTGNDCALAGAQLIATDVVSGQAGVTIRKESSVDGTTWFDPVASAPTLTSAMDTQHWRVTITTPSAAPQAMIPTLQLTDTLPGILNVASAGAPSHVTPAITVTTSVTAGAATGSCPNVAAGSAGLACTFTNVAPGTTIVVGWTVQRPFASGTLTNTATLGSPDAIVSGTTSDAAALLVQPRLDIAATTKTVTPATPRIGQLIQFTVTARNLGPDDVSAAGDFTFVDDLNTDPAVGVAFGDITASGAQLNCVVTTSALAGEPALAAGRVRVRCTSTTAVERYATRTLTIGARVLKPTGALPAAGNVYAAQQNSVRVDVPDTLCEFKTETTSNPAVSNTCNDGPSTSNNTRIATFDVQVPQIDLQQRKVRVLPAGQNSFGVGQPLRYRFRLQNNGPSRAEGVTMTDRFTVPAGFTLHTPQVFNVNGVAAEAGYTLDTAKNTSVRCTQAAANADLVCLLSTTASANFLDAGREVNFEVELRQTGNSNVPVTFGNQALVCADESAQYESSGSCDRGAANNNNVAAVNDVIFPSADLSLGKSVQTVSPVGVNQPVSFELAARNLGPSAIQQIRIVDTLPPDFELVGTPTLVLDAGITAAPSTATGASMSCVAAPASITVAGQQQTVSCVIDALPGPLGAGAFPVGPALTLRIVARPKDGFFSGPYETNRVNSASISPGLDGGGSALAVDTVAGNNSASAVVQVRRTSLSGRVFLDRNGNGAQDGTAPAEDEGLGNVTLLLEGVDDYGRPVTRSTTSVNAVGATRGDWRFDHLPPGRYTVTETQPAGLLDSPGVPAAPSHGGSYVAAASPTSSRWSTITLPLGAAGAGYLFPEVLPTATIAGHVFSDRGDNGALDAVDAGLGGVTLGLYAAATVCPALGALPPGALQTVLSDASGAYRFTGVPVGSAYVVCQRQPDGHADRAPLPGAGNVTPRANQIDVAVLGAGGSVGNDFPEVLGRISGRVFLDFNAAAPGNANNGVQDAGEPGIGSAAAGAGVPITLTGTPSAGPGAGVPIAPVTVYTAADGSWSFDELLPGTYSVAEGVIPLALGVFQDGINTAGPVTVGSSGTAGAVGDNAIRSIVLGAAGASSSGNLFAERPRAAIWGLVFVDANRDRAFTSADTGRIADVLIELRQGGTSCADGTRLGATRSAADGSFVFPGGTVTDAQVVAGQSYRVCEIQPPAFADGPTLPGTSATSARANEILVTGLPLSGAGDQRFGEWPATPAAPQPSFIEGTVYVDRDRDGRLTGADPTRIGGVVVRLVAGDSCSGSEIGRTTTDDAGRWRFPGGNVAAARVLAGERYSVCQEQPADWVDGSIQPGDGARTPARNHILIDGLPAGGSAANHFGEWGARLDGHVWLDRDADGRREAGEEPIPGVLITLEGAGAPRSATTDVAGHYVFDDLPAGRYRVSEPREQPRLTLDGRVVDTFDGATVPGTRGGTATPVGTLPSAIDGIELPAGASSLDNDFGEVPSASIAGRVWLDDNRDGIPDLVERGIAGVTVVLSGTDDQGRVVTATRTTDAEGRYGFDGLRPGTYTVTEPTQPAGTTNGVTRAGSTGGSATPVGTLPSAISGIPLGPGQRSTANDFGELPPSAGPDLVASKAAREARFVSGRSGHYTISVRNIGQGATSGRYTVSDRLPAGLTLAAAPVGSGWACDGAAGATRLSCSSSTELAAGAAHPSTIEITVQVGTTATPVSNALLIDGGGEPPERGPGTDARDRFDTRPDTLPTCTPAATQDACRSVTEVVAPAALSGTVWLDAGPGDRRLDAGDRRLEGWIVELVDPATGAVIATQRTAPDGRYRFGDLEPGVPLAVRFRDPGSGVVVGLPVNGEQGVPAAPCDGSALPRSCASRGDVLLRVVLAPGQELKEQSLPVRPTGTVYGSTDRSPVGGAVVTLTPVGSCPGWDPATQLLGASFGGYAIGGGVVRLTTGPAGFYFFVPGPDAPPRCVFSIGVEPPPGLRFPSELIPSQPQPLRPGGGADTTVRVQPQPLAPSGEPGTATTWYQQVELGRDTPVVVHNHVPLDPAIPATLSLTKTGDRSVAEIGDSVRYRISVSAGSGAAPRQVTVVDRLPAGFTYIAGSATVDGRRIADPAGASGPRLAFQLGALGSGGTLTLQYRVRVGVGAAQGDGINRALAHGCAQPGSCVAPDTLEPLPQARASNEGSFRVRVTGGVFGLEACVVGKVFVDCNGNHVQDREELGIPGVRVLLQDGTFLTSDSEGKYSMCGLPPKSHVLRIDERTLPRGARLTTSSNRNLGDAGSLWLDLKPGELHRADVVEGSCSNAVLDQVKARRAAGEVSAPETERPGRPALRFDSKAHGRDAATTPGQGTDSANQPVPRARPADDRIDGGRHGTR